MAQLALAGAAAAGQFADKKLQKIAEESQISEDMVEWWRANKCETIEKVAIVCTAEKEVRGLIIDGMNASKADMCKVIGDQAAVKLFWHRSRDAWEKASAAEDVSVPVGDLVIPDRESKSMVALWADMHNYVLPDCHMLVASQTAKVWSGFEKENRELEHWFASKLRHRRQAYAGWSSVLNGTWQADGSHGGRP